MNFSHLRQHCHEHIDFVQEAGYSASYIRCLKENIRWILNNEGHKSWSLYLEIYYDRIGSTESELYKKNHRVSFGAIQQFDLYGEFPNRRIKNCFIIRGAYHLNTAR